MRILFIGGTGNLSYDASRRALDLGHELYHLNRGLRQVEGLEGVRSLKADIADEEGVRAALGKRDFDAVVDFIAYTPDQVERDIRLFSGRTAQYVFLSSTSAYRKPPVHHVMTESTPLDNPYWAYARDKIACEALLRRAWEEQGFPATIVRPSHTYGRTWLPTSWTSGDFTVAARMLAGKEVPITGDGQALWTITHARDFAVGLVGLLGCPAALGDVFQITGEESLTWGQIFRALAAALGVEPKLVNVSADFIARLDAPMGERYLGDKCYTSLFDCSKVKRLVPEFRTTVPFHRGIRESVDWYLADPSRQKVNAEVDAVIERVLAAWDRAMAAAFPDGGGGID